MTTETKSKRVPKPTPEEQAKAIVDAKEFSSFEDCPHGEDFDKVRDRWTRVNVAADDPKRFLVTNCDCCIGPMLRPSPERTIPEFCTRCAPKETGK